MLRLLAALAIIAGLPSAARAGIKLSVDGIDGDMKTAALAATQIAQYGSREVSAAQARRLFDAAPEQIEQALRPFGYYDATVTGDLDRQGADWVATLHVDPGRPVKVTQVDITLPGPAADVRGVRHALRSFHPRVGERLNDATYEASKAALQAALAADGFLHAKLTVHKVLVTRASHSAVIKLAFEPGPRYRFGDVRFSGSQFEQGFLQRYVPFETGDWFSQDDLLLLQRSLNGADYFSLVDVQPDIDASASDAVVDVDVTVTPAKRSIYTGGPFIGTDTGVGIRLGLERRWVNDEGHKWKNELVLAQRLKTLSTQYSIPLPGHKQRSLNFGAKYRDADTSTAHSRTLELVGDETRLWHDWTRTLGLHVLAGTFTVGQRRGEDPGDEGIEHGRSHLVFPEASLSRKQGANPIFVRNGWSLALAARSTVGELLSDARFSQLTADAKWIHAFGRRDRLILRGDAGTTWTNGFHELPPQLRFFAGGSRSVRGYGYQSIGPRNDADRVIGGRNLLVFGSTFEHYFTRHWGIAAFIDAGNAFNDLDYRPDIGAGLGLRWLSPVGMVRLDLGVPVHNDRHHGVQLHLLIGPDL